MNGIENINHPNNESGLGKALTPRHAASQNLNSHKARRRFYE